MMPELRNEEPIPFWDLPYDVYGKFAISLCRHLSDPNVDQDYVSRAFALLNAMSRSPDNDIQSLLTVGVLEILTDDENVRRMAEERLNDEGRLLLRQADEFWHKPRQPP